MDEKKNQIIKESFYIDVKNMMRGIKAEKEGDYETAYTCFKQAADAGNPVAAFFIGNMYYFGEYGAHELFVFDRAISPYDSFTQTKPDYVKAFEWFIKAAEDGYPDAMKNIGIMYYLGRGVESDDEAAKRWLTKAANIGVKRVEQILAELFESDDACHSQSKV